MPSIREGDRVIVDKVYTGRVKYIGQVGTKKELVAGIELDVPAGNTNGTWGQKKYFKCSPKHGVFRNINEVHPYHKEQYNQTGLLPTPIIEEISEDKRVETLLDENVEIQRTAEHLAKENKELRRLLEQEKEENRQLRRKLERTQEESNRISLSFSSSPQEHGRSPREIILELFHEIKAKIERETRIFSTSQSIPQDT